MMSNKQDTKKKPAGGPGSFASLYQRLQEKARAEEEAKKGKKHRPPFPGCLCDETWEPSDEDLANLVKGIGEEARRKLMRVLKEAQK